jgi:hypothetical protein
MAILRHHPGLSAFCFHLANLSLAYCMAAQQPWSDWKIIFLNIKINNSYNNKIATRLSGTVILQGSNLVPTTSMIMLLAATPTDLAWSWIISYNIFSLTDASQSFEEEFWEWILRQKVPCLNPYSSHLNWYLLETSSAPSIHKFGLYRSGYSRT